MNLVKFIANRYHKLLLSMNQLWGQPGQIGELTPDISYSRYVNWYRMVRDKISKGNMVVLSLNMDDMNNFPPMEAGNPKLSRL